MGGGDLEAGCRRAPLKTAHKLGKKSGHVRQCCGAEGQPPGIAWLLMSITTVTLIGHGDKMTRCITGF